MDNVHTEAAPRGAKLGLAQALIIHEIEETRSRRAGGVKCLSHRCAMLFVFLLGRNCMSSGESRTRREILTDAAKAGRGSFHFGVGRLLSQRGRELARRFDVHEPGTTSAAGVPPAVTPTVVEVFRPESVVNYVIDPAAVGYHARCGPDGVG